MDPATQKRIVFTQLVGIPLVIGLAVLVYMSFLSARLPTWVGCTALIAEAWASSFLIGRIQLLRKRR